MANNRPQSFGLPASELPNLIKRAKQRFVEIKTKFPTISAYVVFAKGGGQANLSASLISILDTFPSFFADSKKKEHALAQLTQRNQLAKALKDGSQNKERERLEQIDRDLKVTVEELEMEFSVQIELRFDELDHDLIKQLRSDDLVDRNLTPQIGGIRIVLGTIYDFSEGWT